ncbi:hypothetical protein [Rhodoferax sp. BLA1]|uniref:hypothetical protein n=1 Tax=Rhodoferax sp. BLA1 TaxID=2576062 RepID=UPI0015D39F54|nr:hypothetical protein [Rhodoferax sp. BLA1]
MLLSVGCRVVSVKWTWLETNSGRTLEIVTPMFGYGYLKNQVSILKESIVMKRSVGIEALLCQLDSEPLIRSGHSRHIKNV